jgi:cell division protein FtsB
MEHNGINLGASFVQKHKENEQLKKEIQELKATVAALQERIKNLMAQLGESDAPLLRN